MALVAWALLLASSAQGQQVLGSSGGSFENAESSLTFTIGEPVIATFSQSDITMTNGFHQHHDTPEEQGEGLPVITELPALPPFFLVLLGGVLQLFATGKALNENVKPPCKIRRRQNFMR